MQKKCQLKIKHINKILWQYLNDAKKFDFF